MYVCNKLFFHQELERTSLVNLWLFGTRIRTSFFVRLRALCN